jgi:hypothetical protein
MMQANDRRNWNFDDPAPGVTLSEIESLAVRAGALIFRSQSPLLNTHFVNINGAVAIFSGIEYHYYNYIGAIRRLKSPPGIGMSAVRHEAVAWVNRVGQFYYFLKSTLVTNNIPNSTYPTINYVLPFRNKHSAHRSIDAPRTEDTSNAQLILAMMLSELGGSLWTPRPGVTLPLHSPPFQTPSATHYLAFQMQLPDGSTQNLVIEQDHGNVMLEGYKNLELLLG